MLRSYLWRPGGLLDYIHEAMYCLLWMEDQDNQKLHEVTTISNALEILAELQEQVLFWIEETIPREA